MGCGKMLKLKGMAKQCADEGRLWKMVMPN